MPSTPSPPSPTIRVATGALDQQVSGAVDAVTGRRCRRPPSGHFSEPTPIPRRPAPLQIKPDAPRRRRRRGRTVQPRVQPGCRPDARNVAVIQDCSRPSRKRWGIRPRAAEADSTDPVGEITDNASPPGRGHRGGSSGRQTQVNQRRGGQYSSASKLVNELLSSEDRSLIASTIRDERGSAGQRQPGSPTAKTPPHYPPGRARDAHRRTDADSIRMLSAMSFAPP